MVGLGTHLERLREGRSASREDHELLEGKLVAGVLATVDDVERGAGEDVGLGNTGKLGKVGVEGETLFVRSVANGSRRIQHPEMQLRTHLLGSGGLRDSHGHGKDGVGAELGLVGGTIELDHEVVNLLLRGDGELGVDERGSDDLVDVLDGGQDTYASVHKAPGDVRSSP